MQDKENHCTHCLNKLCMHKVPIFSALNHDDIVKIADLIQHKDYHKGENLITVGNKLDAIVIINEGSVKAYKYTPDGREQILYIFSEGDFFGEQYLLSNQTATYNVEALQTVKVCMLSKADFKQLLQQYPDIAVKIIEELGERMSRLENTMQSMGVRSVDARVGALLIDFAAKYGKVVPEGILIRLPLSREGIANYLGIARETVSRKLGQMESDGLITSVSNKVILIPDKKALDMFVGNME